MTTRNAILRPGRRFSTVFLATALLGTTALAGGRPDDSYRNWFGHAAAGVDFAAGDFADVVDDAFAIRGGATYWPSDKPYGIQLEVAYSKHDFSSSAIRAINDAIQDIDPQLGSVSGGDVDDWSFSISAIWSLGPSTSTGPYLTAGLGLDRVEASITDDGLVYYPPICDPWWWWCVPGGVGPGTVVVASEDSTELSWTLGAGYAFRMGGRSLVFLEARYKSVQTDPETTQVIPLLVGIRW